MFQRIVLALDSWDEARAAVAAASDLANKSPSEVLVVHVHDTGIVSREMVDLKPQGGVPALSEVAADVLTRKAAGERRGLRVNQAARVAEGILRAAAEFGGDTIVLGLRSSGSFAGQPLGSVAHRVIQRAVCPVVVVRSSAAATQGREAVHGGPARAGAGRPAGGQGGVRGAS